MRIISGTKKGAKLFEVESILTRSTTDRVKESIFNIIGPFFQGEIALDFFAGSGSLCLEAVSRGCKFAYLFDHGEEQIKVINQNVQKLGFEKNVMVKQVKYENAFNHIDSKVDIVFLDPPYNKGYVDDCLIKLKKFDVLSENAIIVCEVEKNEQIIYEGYSLVGEYKYGRVKIIILR